MKKVQNAMLILMSLLLALSLFSGCAPAAEAPEETPAATEAPAISEAPAASKGLYTAGTYTAEGAGRNGPIVVEVTFSENAIESVQVVSHSETAGIGDAPIEHIPALVTEHQSLQIDAVTGATLTSNALLSAIESCVEQSGGDVEALKAVVIETHAGDPVDKTADVIILGGGGAGMAAAVTAAQQGASVIVVEKAAALGGNTVRSGGYMNAATETRKKANMTEGQIQDVKDIIALEPLNDAMARWQETVSQQLQEYLDSGVTYLFDSPELHALQTYKGGDFLAKPELIEAMCAGAPETFDWMTSLGFDWRDYSVAVIGSLWPRAQMSQTYKSGIGFIDIYTNTIEKESLPVEILTEVAGEELIVEDGRVTGARASGADGTPYTFHANKGVILATGGFSANVEMRQKYNTQWETLDASIPTTNSPTITGDGIVMAEAIGANLIGMDKIQLLAIADPETGALDAHVGDATSICVNKEGKRYVNETERRDVLAAAALRQTDGIFFIISSTQNDDLDENGYNSYGLHIDDLVAAGEVYRADTLEELATQIGCDPATLVESVKKFNEAVTSGYDPEFGRTVFNTHALIEDFGPYYACPRSPAVHHTMGGVDVDIQTRVLRADGTGIEGLYAAGEVTGGTHGSNRLGGNAITDALTNGRKAGLAVIK